jgi:hypothetical protein
MGHSQYALGINRVPVPMCEHHQESQDTRYPIGFGLLYNVPFSLFIFDLGLIFCALLSVAFLFTKFYGLVLFNG